MGDFDWTQLIAGLGLFLFGMVQLENGVRTLASRSMVRLLRRATGNPAGGILTGTLVTALMQSSSLVGLLVLAFVGAGVMAMTNALGVILGANLGTTVTGWLVTLVGFRLNLGGLGLPLLGLGGLIMALAGERRMAAGIGALILGFGLVLFGLMNMKAGVQVVSSWLDVSRLAGYPAIVYGLTGMLVAAVIQSSSATMMMTLSALNAGLITLPVAAAIVIGADLGTTSTLLIAAVRGDAAKRQVAAFHFIYNLSTALLGFVILLPLLGRLQALAGLHDPLYSLVAFHSFFNLVGIFVFLPFLGVLGRWLEQRFLGRDDHIALFIDRVPASVTEASCAAVERESIHLLRRALSVAGFPFGIRVALDMAGPRRPWWPLPLPPDFHVRYEEVKQLEGEIIHYLGQIQQSALSPEEAARLGVLQESIRSATYAAKAIKDIRADMVELDRIDNPGWRHLSELLASHVQAVIEALGAMLSESGGDPVGIRGLMTQHGDFAREFASQIYVTIRQHPRLPGPTVLNVMRESDAALQELIRGFIHYFALNEASDEQSDPVGGR